MLRDLWSALPILAILLPGTVAYADDPTNVPSPCWMVNESGQVVDLEEYCLNEETPAELNSEADAGADTGAVSEASAPEETLLIDGAASPGVIIQTPVDPEADTAPDPTMPDSEDEAGNPADEQEVDPDEPNESEPSDAETLPTDAVPTPDDTPTTTTTPEAIPTPETTSTPEAPEQ